MAPVQSLVFLKSLVSLNYYGPFTFEGHRMGRREVDNSSKRGNGGLRFKTMKMFGHSESKLKWLLEGILF